MTASMKVVVVAAAVLLAFAAGTSADASSAKSKSKPVTSLMNAKWENTPFWLEAAEIMADEDATAYWEAVDFLVEEESAIGASLSDRDLYDKCVSFASRFLSASQTSLLKLSLSLRTHSPRLEMFQQVSE